MYRLTTSTRWSTKILGMTCRQGTLNGIVAPSTSTALSNQSLLSFRQPATRRNIIVQYFSSPSVQIDNTMADAAESDNSSGGVHLEHSTASTVKGKL
jgi:hypothetical protein